LQPYRFEWKKILPFIQHPPSRNLYVLVSYFLHIYIYHCLLAMQMLCILFVIVKRTMKSMTNVWIESCMESKWKQETFSKEMHLGFLLGCQWLASKTGYANWKNVDTWLWLPYLDIYSPWWITLGGMHEKYYLYYYTIQLLTIRYAHLNHVKNIEYLDSWAQIQYQPDVLQYISETNWESQAGCIEEKTLELHI